MLHGTGTDDLDIVDINQYIYIYLRVKLKNKFELTRLLKKISLS
jgi:hypothetical protein